MITFWQMLLYCFAIYGIIIFSIEVVWRFAVLIEDMRFYGVRVGVSRWINDPKGNLERDK